MALEHASGGLQTAQGADTEHMVKDGWCNGIKALWESEKSPAVDEAFSALPPSEYQFRRRKLHPLTSPEPAPVRQLRPNPQPSAPSVLSAVGHVHCWLLCGSSFVANRAGDSVNDQETSARHLSGLTRFQTDGAELLASPSKDPKEQTYLFQFSGGGEAPLVVLHLHAIIWLAYPLRCDAMRCDAMRRGERALANNGVAAASQPRGARKVNKRTRMLNSVCPSNNFSSSA